MYNKSTESLTKLEKDRLRDEEAKLRNPLAKYSTTALKSELKRRKKEGN